MRKEVLKEPIFAKEIAEIIKVSPSMNYQLPCGA